MKCNGEAVRKLMMTLYKLTTHSWIRTITCLTEHTKNFKIGNIFYQNQMRKKSIWPTMDTLESWQAQRASYELVKMSYLISFKTFNQFRICDSPRTCPKHPNVELSKAIKMMNQWHYSRHIEAAQSLWRQIKSATTMEIGWNAQCRRRINCTIVGFCRLMIPRTIQRRKTCCCKIYIPWRPTWPTPRRINTIHTKRALRAWGNSRPIGFRCVLLRTPTVKTTRREPSPLKRIAYQPLIKFIKILINLWISNKPYQPFKIRQIGIQLLPVDRQQEMFILGRAKPWSTLADLNKGQIIQIYHLINQFNPAQKVLLVVCMSIMVQTPIFSTGDTSRTCKICAANKSAEPRINLKRLLISSSKTKM